LVAPLTARAQEQYGTVYFYRGVDTPDMKEVIIMNPEAEVFLDGHALLSMPERTFVGLKIPAGQYMLSMRRKGTRRQLYVEANKTYYLHVEQTVYPYTHQLIYDAEERGAQEAIRKCYALKAKKIKSKLFEVIKVKPNSKAS
jgi:hypothetical protein